MAGEERGTLRETEAHPMCYYARDWILENYTIQELYLQLEALSSCAIEGNNIGEICGETLRRMLHGESYSDRYIMGLAWYLMRAKNREKENE